MLRWAISRVLGTRNVIENEIVTGYEFGPTSLTVVQDFHRYEYFEILVIRSNMDRVF